MGKMHYICVCVCACMYEYYLAKKKNELQLFVAKWMKLNQKAKQRLHILSHMQKLAFLFNI